MPAIDRCCSCFPPTSYILYLQPSLSCFQLSWPLAILCSYRWQLCRQEHIRRGFILLEALAACRGTSHTTKKPPVPEHKKEKQMKHKHCPTLSVFLSLLFFFFISFSACLKSFFFHFHQLQFWCSLIDSILAMGWHLPRFLHRCVSVTLFYRLPKC